MNTYTTTNGIYDIYVDFDIAENTEIFDYIYFQMTDDIKNKLTSNGYREDIFCSATALANCLAIYYNDFNVKPLNFYKSFEAGGGELSYWGTSSDNILVDTDDNPIDCPRDAGGRTMAMAIDTSSQQFSDYVNEIKSSLNVGKPVIITVNRSGKTHFVTIVGVKSGVNLEDAQYTDFVMFDPGTYNSVKKLSTLDDTYKGYTYYPYNYRIITPYLIDENGEFILDENGNKTTDPKYAQTNISDITIDKELINIFEYAFEKFNELLKIKKQIESIKKYKNIVSSISNVFTKASKTVYDPLILDLDGDGFNVETKENGTNFDLADLFDTVDRVLCKSLLGITNFVMRTEYLHQGGKIMKKKFLSILTAIAVAMSLSACRADDTGQSPPLSETTQVEATTQESVKLPYGYEDATVVDDETMDFWRSLLCIKGEPITFPCTYNELKNILDKHSITIKPSGCWSDDNPDDRDVCFVDLYDGDTYFMALIGTCVSEDDLESYIFDGTLVGEPAQNYISINKQEPIFIGDMCKDTILDIPLKSVGNNGNLVATVQVKNELYFCEVRYKVNSNTNMLESFSINVCNIGGNKNE